MSHAVEIRLPRHVTIALGRLDDERLELVLQQLADAEKSGHGLIIAEHKRMQVIEISGITTGRIVAELRLIPCADPVAALAGYRSDPPDGLTVIGLIPAGMLAKAAIVAVEAVPATMA